MCIKFSSIELIATHPVVEMELSITKDFYIDELEKFRIDFIGKNRKCVVITMYQSSHILKKMYTWCRAKGAPRPSWDWPNPG